MARSDPARGDERGDAKSAVGASAGEDGATHDSGVTTSEPESFDDHALSLFDLMHQRQLRESAGEIAAAIAHAMGTPLNVISGRAELIRQDPARAATQAVKIEEQVRTMASGLRQLVDYLAPPEPTTPGVPARTVFEEALTLVRPIAERQGVTLTSNVTALDGIAVQRWHLLSNLVTLASLAIRCAVRAPHDLFMGAEPGSPVPRVLIHAAQDSGNLLLEIDVPALEVLEGWQLDKFHARPLPATASEDYRVLSICASIARGNGGRLSLEAITGGARLRLLCRAATT